MTTKDAAGILGVAESTVRWLIRRGRIASSKIGQQHWIERREVQRVKAERKRNPPRRGNPNFGK